MCVPVYTAVLQKEYSTIWRETLVGANFGEFATKTVGEINFAKFECL